MTRCFIPALWAQLAFVAFTGLAHAQAVETLTPYPRAKEFKRYINPLEQGTLPISPPEKSAGLGHGQSRWRMSYEGAVSVLQYDHQPDDSPLLIARHYAGELKARGFDLVTVCEIPCTAPDGGEDHTMAWRDELDMTRKMLDLYRFGSRGLYFIAHKADAVAAVRVGQFGSKPVSTVKLVKAPALDLGPLRAWIAQQQTPSPGAALPAPPQVARPAPAAPPAPPKIVDVPSDALAAWLEQHAQQRVLIQFTSFDPNCGFCARSNPVFATLSSRPLPEGTVFVRVSYQPWTSVSQSPVAQHFKIGGLPFFVTVEGGRVTRQRGGHGDEATLRRELID